MKTLILILGLVLAVTTGCKSTSAERLAYNVSKTIVTTAASARDAWAIWYVRERNRLAGDVAGLAELEKTRSQVNAAWFKFQNVSTTIILGQEAAFSNTNGVAAQVSAGMSAAAEPFINLVISIIK